MSQLYFYGNEFSGRYGMNEQDVIKHEMSKDELIEVLSTYQHLKVLNIEDSNPNVVDEFLSKWDSNFFDGLFNAYEPDMDQTESLAHRISTINHDQPLMVEMEEFNFAIATTKQLAVYTYVGLTKEDENENWNS